MRRWQPGRINPGLERIRRLLRQLGDPQHHLPEVVHVAGTNGKGSTIAFLRAILEAAGRKVHVYTSPHLVSFAERIRVAGNILCEDKLLKWLEQCELVNRGGSITYFELTTAMAFLAFAGEPADVTLLETGLGGRLDATNVIERPAVTAITRISFDHMQFLGSTLEDIAREKAGIIKRQAVAVLTPQPQFAVEQVLQQHAQLVGACVHSWQVTSVKSGFHFESAKRSLTCPAPNLVGDHQKLNAATAIACLDGLGEAVSSVAVEQGLTTASWPGRLQRLRDGPLIELLPPHWEVWLDGGHNDSAGEVLAHQAECWQRENPNVRLIIILGMLASKQPVAFLTALARSQTVNRIYCLAIPGDRPSFAPDELARTAMDCGIANATVASSIDQACRAEACQGSNLSVPRRILICGSLALVGVVLASHR